MKALLIIDMQNTSFTPITPRFDSEGVVQRINKLSHKFRLAGDMVIFIQHDGTKEGFCVPNTVKDAHTTADRPNLKAKQVIDHYNWIWSEMTPTKGRINVIAFDNYLERLSKK
jgi:nicotinamidase-related amidase